MYCKSNEVVAMLPSLHQWSKNCVLRDRMTEWQIFVSCELPWYYLFIRIWSWHMWQWLVFCRAVVGWIEFSGIRMGRASLPSLAPSALSQLDLTLTRRAASYVQTTHPYSKPCFSSRYEGIWKVLRPSIQYFGTAKIYNSYGDTTRNKTGACALDIKTFRAIRP